MKTIIRLQHVMWINKMWLDNDGALNLDILWHFIKKIMSDCPIDRPTRTLFYCLNVLIDTKITLALLNIFKHAYIKSVI